MSWRPADERVSAGPLPGDLIMAAFAMNSRTEEEVDIAEADPEASFICGECGANVSYVRSHTRSNVPDRIPAHFSYRGCDCIGDYNPDGDSSHSYSGGGGGGESKIHKRRKFGARAAIAQEYEGYDDTEVFIGEKQADAFLELDEPHETYGKGFALEYQHKNESKDLVETERHYAKHGFTTLWLWEDQFEDLTGVPTVRLFDGRVQTPWPYVVPDDWQVDHLPSDRYRMQVAVGKHPPQTSVPCRTLTDWTRPSPREHWRDVGWDAGFNPGFRPDHRKGALTKIEAVIPDAEDYPPDERQSLACKECPWRGGISDYHLKPQEGHQASRAVCPECGGQMHLARSA